MEFKLNLCILSSNLNYFSVNNAQCTLGWVKLFSNPGSSKFKFLRLILETFQKFNFLGFGALEMPQSCPMYD